MTRTSPLSPGNGNTQRKKCQLVKLPDGRVIAWVDGDTLVKPVSASRHLLKKFHAWALDSQVFTEVKPFVNWLVFWDKESDTVYKVSVSYFDQHKGEIEFDSWGRQYYLPLSQFEIEVDKNKPRQLRLELWEGKNEH